MPGSQPVRPRRAPVAAALLVAVLTAGLLPMPVAVGVEAPGSRVPTAQADAAPPGQQPSIAYLEAEAHEDDVVEFKPGGRVEVGFTPRAGDRWPIDGHVPGALPPGRATGKQMAASDNGSHWADTARPDSGDTTPAPIDAPAEVSVTAAQRVSLAEPGEPAFDLAAASGLRRQVFGFLPYWELSGAATKLNYDVLSTIAYFSVGADSKGNLKKKDADGTSTTGWGGWTSSSMTGVINAAHQRGTRVVLTASVFAWTSTQASVQRAILGSATARRNLARQAAAAVRDRGADGINLDFEPLASGYADEFVALVRAIRGELNRIRSGYQLTFDTTGSIGNYPLERSLAAGAADAVFVMGYDYRTSGSSSAGSIDPLSGPRYDLTDTVRAYTARVKPSRVILGLPWYGRAWSTNPTTSRRPPGVAPGTATARRSTTRTSRISCGSMGGDGIPWSRARTSPTAARTAPARTAARPAGARSITTTGHR